MERWKGEKKKNYFPPFHLIIFPPQKNGGRKMLRAKIIETNLAFRNALGTRGETSKIVIHHTGGTYDVDASASEIHQWHLDNGWAGIGYHFVIRKDGTIERGRPIEAIGAHAEKHNSYTVGIHVCGQFNVAQPTAKQIESLALLVANICSDYKIPMDRNHIIGHDECYTRWADGSGCPGRNLQAMLETVKGKAIWYANQQPDAAVKKICPHCGAVIED